MGWMQYVQLTPEEDAALDQACEDLIAQAQGCRLQALDISVRLT
jgi:hypothetical protein